MMKLKHILIITTFLLSINLFAGVNLKNGNFYISYTDIQMKSDLTAFKDITRTYNSKSTFVGLFGYGWGSAMETYLHSYPDGTIVVIEHGSGGTTVFNSELVTEDMVEFMIDQLIDVAIEQGDLENNPNTILERRDKLLNNHNYRIKLWDRYVKKELLFYETDFPEGMEWETHERGNELLVKTESGYRRTSGKKIEEFNLEGKLTKVDNGNGKWSVLEYANNQLSKMNHGDGSEYLFEFNDLGFISYIHYNDKKSTYKYNNENLVYSRDLVGNHFQHMYDSKHNMIKIVYNPLRDVNIEEDAMHMEYDPKTSWILKITDRDGDVTEYAYDVFYKEDGSVDNDHYGTKVTKQGYNGKLFTNSYEYVIGTKENGERFTQKISTTINNISTQTTYDELCGSPIEIIRGDRKTTFKYNNRCLLVEKISASDSIYMKYHPKLEKMTYVKNSSGEYKFEYNDSADLTYANKNNDVWARLIYNEEGKITEMQQEDKTLVFKYNEMGKPVKIEIEGLGGINVTYDEYGEIERVSSEDGHKMALQVTQAFQNLLALVKPAGVNLNM